MKVDGQTTDSFRSLLFLLKTQQFNIQQLLIDYLRPFHKLAEVARSIGNALPHALPSAVALCTSKIT